MSEYGVSHEFDLRSIQITGTIDESREAGYKYLNDSACRSCHDSIEWWETPLSRKTLAIHFGSAVPHFHTCSSLTHERPTVGRSGYKNETE